MSEAAQPQNLSMAMVDMSRDEQLAYMAKHAEKIQSENPDQDLKTDSQWWAPAINLGVDIRNDLDKETSEKLNACIAKLAACNYAPQAVDEASTEARVILADHPEMLARVDAAIFQRKDALAKLHEYAASEAAAGRVAFGSCALLQK